MSRRFWTADFHLGFTRLLEIEGRPFASIEEHDAALLKACRVAKEGDVIVHVGDLASVNYDNHDGRSKGLACNPMDIVKGLGATLVNVRGNHDLNNKVRSVCDSMQVHLGKRFPCVTVGHYPSTDKRSADYVKKGWINLCGHVHKKWHHLLDLTNQVLNINVGVDANGYKLVSDDELIRYIEHVLSMPKSKLNKAEIINGKVQLV